MKTDLYTKTFLTLIALSLVVLAFDKVYDVAIPESQATFRSHETWLCMETDGWTRRYDDSFKDSPRVSPEALAIQFEWTFMTTPVLRKGIYGDEWFVCGRKEK